jgi:hypothetical protein
MELNPAGRSGEWAVTSGQPLALSLPTGNRPLILEPGGRKNAAQGVSLGFAATRSSPEGTKETSDGGTRGQL